MGETLFERLLKYYHIDIERYHYLTREVELNTFNVEHKFDRINEAVELVNHHINKKSKIIVYGDYDADGICGTSILVKMFKYKDYLVDYYIPSRYLDGYGINLNQAKRIKEEGYDFVICVDNGVSANEAINYLKENNIDVLVLDHHEIPEVLPNANIILHPTYSHYGDIASSGSFVAFIFSIDFLGYFDKYLSILASISLISDMMPLKEYNRDLLRYVIANYKVGEFLPIDLLNARERFNEDNIGLGIAPKINAIGRVKEDTSVNDLVRFLCGEDETFCLNYISVINEVNEERKELSKKLSDSLPSIEKNAVCEKIDCKEGLIGLVANRVANEHGVPTIIFTKEENNGCIKGSSRAPEGFNIVECFNHLKDYLVNFGGHAQAGGCAIKKEDFHSFQNKFYEYCSHHKVVVAEKESIELFMTELTLENYDIIKSFSPFGEAWKAPLFKIKNIRTSALNFSKDGNHILTNVGLNSKLVGFYMPRNQVCLHDRIDIIGTLRTSYFKGRVSLDFVIDKFLY